MAKATRSASTDNNWLGLTIGNSRLHWAWFSGDTLEDAWDTEHLSAAVIKQLQRSHFDVQVWFEAMRSLAQTEFRLEALLDSPVWIASVVPDRLKLWQNYPKARIISLDRIPLQATYPTLGIDRALALWGAGTTLGWPVLVLDAGTALTFTGGDRKKQLVGGAILPGLGLQLQTLSQKTAALPLVREPQSASLPPRWALNTSDAISSGVIYTLLAGVCDFIHAWRQDFPEGSVALTGGDAKPLFTYLQILYPDIAAFVTADPHLIFWGMRSVVMADG